MGNLLSGFEFDFLKTNLLLKNKEWYYDFIYYFVFLFKNKQK